MQLKQSNPESNRGPTVVIADDLSGAAECAAEFAQPGMPTVLRLVQDFQPAQGGTLVWDLDTRDAAPALEPNVLESIHQSRRTYVKIDSLLRGNWAALVAVVAQSVARPIVLCSALPRLERGMRDGFIELAPALVAGQRLAPFNASAIHGLALAGVSAGHFRLGTGTNDAIRQRLSAALQRDTVTVVDATTDTELDTLALALESLPGPYIAIGSAGLASALARLLAPPASVCALGQTSSMAILVGSQTGPAREQLAELVAESGEAVSIWNASPGHTAAFPAPPQGRVLHLFSTQLDESNTQGGRDLTRRFVHDALANLPPVDYFVATGGETARALCDELGIAQIDVLGQVEPGVSLARMSTPGGVLHLVLKSGSFGDPGTLVRVARMGGLLSNTYLERRI
jgi:uncharacterized protein YgbK (DUF1537 family)